MNRKKSGYGPAYQHKAHDYGTGKQDAYDNLINAIFKQGYDDLVGAIQMMDVAKLRLNRCRYESYQDELRNLKRARYDVTYLEEWFRVVLPQWRDLDADKIIEQAYKEARDEAEGIPVRG